MAWQERLEPFLDRKAAWQEQPERLEPFLDRKAAWQERRAMPCSTHRKRWSSGEKPLERAGERKARLPGPWQIQNF
jgi:hypothetical protein